MSHYGYPYGPPPGYQPPAYSYPAQQVYAPPNYPPPEGPPPGSFPGYDAASQASYSYNQNSIPGLGLNFPNQNQAWQHGWANQTPGLPQPVSAGQISVQGNDVPRETRPVREKQTTQAAAADEMEEGELEDAYEPQGVEDLAITGLISSHREASQLPPSPTRTQTIGDASAVFRNDVEPPLLSRDRSGSYSPFLTSKEINTNTEGTPVSDALQQVDYMASSVAQPVTSLVKVGQNGAIGKSSSENQDPAKRETTFLDVKKKAQDAILGLWPLNVRYEHYVEEGINKNVLTQLFTELGLNIPEDMPPSEKVAMPLPVAEEAEETTPAVEAKGPTPKDTKSKKIETKIQIEKPKDKAEERKDKIARLLALKGSRHAAKPATPSTTNMTSPVATTPSSNTQGKTVSEKSKLLQQKMEALKKAREAKAEKTSLKDSTTTTNGSIPPSTSPTNTPAPAVMSASEEESSLPQPPMWPAESQHELDSQATPAIPGLFLSPTAQPSPGPSSRKRPLAADLNEAPTSSAPKRQFGQPRELRPFLIDVSDDDDDAEMDIDSPEQQFSSVHRPTTPVGKTSSFRDHAALPDSVPPRSLSTPSGLGTPSGTSGTPNGRYDLESMNKKIEDMKRKIAEAEARKKARQSRQGTPSLPQSQQESKENSAGPPVLTKPPFPLVRAETEDNRSTAPFPTQTTLVLPKIRGRSPQPHPSARARVASERLPLIEARRRDKESQLKHLESEIARIKQEIQDDVAEEDRLREEVDRAEEAEPEREAGLGQGSPSSKSEPSLVQVSVPRPLADTSAPSPPVVPLDSVCDTSDQTQEIAGGRSPDGVEINEPQITSAHELDTRLKDGEEASEAPTHADISIDTKVPVSSEDKRQEGAQDGAASDSQSGSDPNSDSEPEPTSDPNPDDDIAMDEADEMSGADDSAESSDEYEPEEAIEPPGQQIQDNLQAPRQASNDEDGPILETTDIDMQGVASTSPVTLPISVAREDTGSSEAEREVGPPQDKPVSVSVSQSRKSTFVPYETPLRYFTAFRFHPDYNTHVAGGLKSLTYSNKIDIHKEVCPDQLIHGACPRRPACEFQHFEDIEAPDDHILLQLGAYGNFEGEKHKYIAGLRELLGELRGHKIKDFRAISEAIIKYRAQFHGDKMKILPLGNVTI